MWFKKLVQNVWGVFSGLRLSYLPPLMIYVAAGISSLTQIVGTFFVKDYLGLSAAFLAGLAFWAGIPWALKMPLGHLVDLIWKWKSILVYLGASLIAGSLAIMVGLIGYKELMEQYLSVEAWYVISTILAPVGYVLQDVVADAMTVEAVPTTDDAGNELDPQTVKQGHTIMQTLGRVAIVTGGIAVAVINLLMFSGVETMEVADKADAYMNIYLVAFFIPVVSVLGVVFASFLKRLRMKKLRANGLTEEEIQELYHPTEERVTPNWWILGGSLLYVILVLSIGTQEMPFKEEIVFAGSMGIVLFLMWQLTKQLSSEARRVFIGTALVIFAFRAVPTPGPGSTWWQIDVLGFDQHFQSILLLTANIITLLIMIVYAKWLADKSLTYTYGLLTIVGTVLSLPIIGMFYGLHEWTAALTDGVVNARFIALIDTALESPLGQVAMIPALAWTAHFAPRHLKATFFAVVASFSNLALSASALGTKYLNEYFVITREVVDEASGQIVVPADYSQLGTLLIIVTIISFVLPLLAILFVRLSRLKSW